MPWAGVFCRVADTFADPARLDGSRYPWRHRHGLRVGAWRGGTDVALTVGLTMFLVVLIGSLVGMSLPFLLHKLKLDPATASGPLVTTISDGMGVLIYFSIASVVLGL